MTEAEPAIRPGTAEDIADLTEIYNHFVRETHVTFDIEPFSTAQRLEWLEHYRPRGRHRIFVAVTGGRVIGFATSSPYRAKRAYETSVETSVYCRPEAHGRGVGSALYTALFDALANEDVHRAYGGVALPNDASESLHRKFGFERVAIFSEQGRKFGRYWDVAWYERRFP
jgi:phosphinothricin acetyltransferase